MLYEGKKVIDMGDFIENLKIGDIMPVQLRRKSGVILVEKGRKITQRIKVTLKRLLEENEIEHIKIDEMDPKDADKLLNMGRKPTDTVNNQVMVEARESIGELMGDFNSSNVQKVKEVMREVVRPIEGSAKFQHNIERRYVEYANDKSSHAIAVACFSILLAKIYNTKIRASELQISKDDLINLEDIAVAAVLRDKGENIENIGEIPPISQIPKDIQEVFPAIKEVPLDKYDKNYSSVYSYLLSQNISNEIIDDNIRTMILLSNEPETGKGCLKTTNYSSTQKKSGIIGAKIIHIADIYDRLMEKTIRQGKSLEEVAIAMLKYKSDGTFNKYLGEQFMREVVLYPEKTRVILSNDKLAMVIRNHSEPEEIYKPTVKELDSCIIRDLRTSTTITIRSLVPEEKYHEIVQAQIQGMKNIAISNQKKKQDMIH